MKISFMVSRFLNNKFKMNHYSFKAKQKDTEPESLHHHHPALSAQFQHLPSSLCLSVINHDTYKTSTTMMMINYDDDDKYGNFYGVITQHMPLQGCLDKDTCQRYGLSK